MIKTFVKTITTAALVLALPATAFAAPKPKVQFGKNAYAVAESAGSATINVLRPRTGKALARISKQVSVDYAATAGSAVAGTNFTPVSSTLTFPACTVSTPPADDPCLVQKFSVPVRDDGVADGPKTVNLSLSNARTADGKRAILGFPSTAVLVIVDDDTNGTPQPPTFQMATASDVVGEGAGSETAWVIRSGDLSSAASVDYATADGTAHNLVDYNLASGTLNFPAYDPNSPDPSSIIQGVTVTILHNPATTPPTSDFTVGLSGGTGVLGSPVSEDVTIVNEDGPPSVQWSAPSYSVAENGGPVHLTVFAAGSIGSEMDVDYATADGSALAGTEYTSQSDTLQFFSGDVAESIDIPVMDDGTTGDKSFTTALSNVVGGALGTPAVATVDVLNVDQAAANTGSGGAGNSGDGSSGTPASPAGGDQGNQLVLGARQSACGLTVTAAKKQKLLKKKALILKLRAGQACKVSLSATIKQLIKKRSRAGHSARALRFSSKKVSLSLQPGKAMTVKVKFTKKTLKAIKKALAARKRLAATVVVAERAGSAPVHKRSLKITVRR